MRRYRAGRVTKPRGGMRVQSRGYLNFYPSPDKDTQPSQSKFFAYYSIPDYTKHMDHKQTRPVELDPHNTTELTREEERVQRIRIMNWREEMRKKIEASNTSPKRYDRKDPLGRGSTVASWSPAQAVEAELRRGGTPWHLKDERGQVDPCGVLEGGGHEAALAAVPKQTHSHPASTWEALLGRTVLQDLRQRFGQLCGGEAMPPAGDLSAMHEKLSASLQKSGDMVTTLRRMMAFLAEHGETLGHALPENDVAQTNRGMMKVEEAVNWCSKEWNSRLEDDLSHPALAAMVNGYAQRGPSGFWGAAATGFHPSFLALHNSFREAARSSPHINPVLVEDVRGLWSDWFQVLSTRLNRQIDAGIRSRPTTDEEWIALAEDYFLKPWREWAVLGEHTEESDGSLEWQVEADEIKRLMASKVLPETTFEEWVRWCFLEQWTVPQTIHDKRIAPLHPHVALAARLANSSWEAFSNSLFEDMMVYVRHHFQMQRSTDNSRPVLLFLRQLVNTSAVPGFNYRLSHSFHAGAAAAEQYSRADKDDPYSQKIASQHVGEESPISQPAPPSDGFLSYDAATVHTIVVEEGLRADTPTRALAAFESARQKAQAMGAAEAIYRMHPDLELREEGREMVRWVAEDAAWCIGHLRRKLALDDNTPSSKISSVAISGHPDKWDCGTARKITWKWCPTSQYQHRLLTPKQKADRRNALYEQQWSEVSAAAKEPLSEWLPTDAGDSSISDEVAVNAVASRLEPRIEWGTLKNYFKWKHAKEREELEEELNVERQHPVHVALYRRNDERLASFKTRRDKIRDFVKKAESEEAQRFVAILQQVRKWAVEMYVAQVEHHGPLRHDTAKLLNAIEAGELEKMWDDDSHLTPEEADRVGELWEYAYDVTETGEKVLPNTEYVRVRLPFWRDESTFPYNVSNTSMTGTFRVCVHEYNTGTHRWGQKGWSEPFEVSDPLDLLFTKYLETGRRDKPPLRMYQGERLMLPVDEVPSLLRFLRQHVELSLEHESSVGNDVIWVKEGSGGAEACVHLDVLKYEIRRDFHREEARLEPKRAFLMRNYEAQRAQWERTHPGATKQEWEEVRGLELQRCDTEEAGWWAYDPEEASLPLCGGRGAKALTSPRAEYMARKAMNLSHCGRGGQEHPFGPALVTARYEGLGYVSELKIDDEKCRKIFTPLPPTPSWSTAEGCSFVEPGREGLKHEVKLNAGGLLWSTTGGEEEQEAIKVASLTFDLAERSLTVNETTTVKLPSGAEGAEVLSKMRQLAGPAGITANLPSALPLGLQTIGAMCFEAINDAHTNLCTTADTLMDPNRTKWTEARWQAGSLTEANEKALYLPTMIQSLREAQTNLESPVGLEVQRRRFDSWQLSSGQGRFDGSPFQGKEWEHPIEENPVLYHMDYPQKMFESR